MSVKLIVDSGSTKTDWVILDSKGERNFSTKGINPSTDSVLPNLKTERPELYEQRLKIDTIFYFGAGVIDESTKSIIKDWLITIFINATEIQIESDLVGAAKATSGDNKGIISILGTGSNSCVYNGLRITDNIPSLGYTLSNEGGGTEIGKRILKSYFYREMPTAVLKEFESHFSLDKSSVVFNLYKGGMPTAYLASFAQFINMTSQKEWRRSLLQPIFQEFIDTRIKKYRDYQGYDLHFVGSIAYFCQDILKEILQDNNLTTKNIIQKPMDGLVRYYK